MNIPTLHKYLPLLALLLLLNACAKDEDAQLAPNAQVETQTVALENELNAKLSDYQIVELDLEALAQQAAAASPNTPIELLIENGLESPWLFELSPTPIFAKNFEWSYHDGKAMIRQDGSHIWSLTGNLADHNHSKVVMTLDGKFLFASLSMDAVHYTIEPLFMQARTNNLHHYIIYKDTDVLANLQTPPPACDHTQAAEDLAGPTPNFNKSTLTSVSGNVEAAVVTDITYYNYFSGLLPPSLKNPAAVSGLISLFTTFTFQDIDANIFEVVFPGTANGLLLSTVRVTTPTYNFGYTPLATPPSIANELSNFYPWYVANTPGVLNNADIGLLIRYYAYTGATFIGYAYTSSVCKNPVRACAAVTRLDSGGNELSPALYRNIIAHEIGHTLGANHPNDARFCANPVPVGSELMTSGVPGTITEGNILGPCVLDGIFNHFSVHNGCL